MIYVYIAFEQQVDFCACAAFVPSDNACFEEEEEAVEVEDDEDDE